MPNYKASQDQLSFIKENDPEWYEWIQGGEFQGDDNDLAVVISRIVDDMIMKKGLDLNIGYFLEKSLTPEGFLTCTLEGYKKHKKTIKENLAKDPHWYGG